MSAGRGTSERELHDGAGHSSPDRWSPEQRILPVTPELSEFSELLKGFVTRHMDREVFAKLVCGRIGSCLILTRRWRHSVSKSTRCSREREGAEKEEVCCSPLEFTLLGAFLRQTGDREGDLPASQMECVWESGPSGVPAKTKMATQRAGGSRSAPLARALTRSRQRQLRVSSRACSRKNSLKRQKRHLCKPFCCVWKPPPKTTGESGEDACC